ERGHLVADVASHIRWRCWRRRWRGGGWKVVWGRGERRLCEERGFRTNRGVVSMHGRPTDWSVRVPGRTWRGGAEAWIEACGGRREAAWRCGVVSSVMWVLHADT